MINIRLAEIMGRKRLNQKAVADMTGIRPNTISALWHGSAKRLDLEHLNKLCEVLECQPGDLFEYVQENKKGKN